MNEEFDSLLRMSLKNWAAGFQPPRHGHAQLLQRARVLNLMNSVIASSLSPSRRELFTSSHGQYLIDEWSKGCHGHIGFWPLQVFSSLRISE
jgi:hypothetical protein